MLLNAGFVEPNSVRIAEMIERNSASTVRTRKFNQYFTFFRGNHVERETCHQDDEARFTPIRGDPSCKRIE